MADVVHLVDCLPSMYKVLIWIHSTAKTGGEGELMKGRQNDQFKVFISYMVSVIPAWNT